MSDTPKPLSPDDPDVMRAVESLDLREAMLAGVAAAAMDLAEVARSLYKASVLSRVERVLVGLLLVGLLVSSIASLITVTRLSTVADTNREGNQYVKECTTPSLPGERHECFEDNNARTAVVIGQLNQSTLAAIICADELDGREAITKCVTDRLAAGANSGGSK